MRTIWNKPPPPNKKYVTRDELPQLVRRAIADIIMGGAASSIDPGIIHVPKPPKDPMRFAHDRLPPPGSIGALRPVKKRERGPQRARSCGHKNRMSACQTCTPTTTN